MYQKLSVADFAEHKLPRVTVHGRFQPPIHRGHFSYISQAFQIADHVTILITNPYAQEKKVEEALHRSDGENNPFTFEERVWLFEQFFDRRGIARERYDIIPFDITNPAIWGEVLGPHVPNLVNTYSPWSEKKLAEFQKYGYKVLHSTLPSKGVSGTGIRKILRSGLEGEALAAALKEAGLMPEAIPGLLELLKKRPDRA